MSATAAPATPTARAGTVAAVTAVVFWGMGNVLVKHIALGGLSIAFNRLWLGSVVYTAAVFISGRRLSWRTLRLALPGGLAFGLDIALFFVALKHTSVADASIITALQPALVFLVAGRLFGERVTLPIVGLTVVAIGGVTLAVVASASNAGRTLEGDLFAAVSLAAWTWYFVASKQARQSLSALEYQAAMTLVATVVVTPVALVASHDLVVHSSATGGWILLMVLVPGGGHLLMNWAHQYAPITLASLVTLGIPVVATIGAAVLLGEPITLAQAAGMGVVLVALGLVLRRPPAARLPVDAPA